jgi:cytochrome b6-f complex iron-sulfur subunit
MHDHRTAIIARPLFPPLVAEPIGRRRLLRTGFAVGAAVSLAGGIATALQFTWPRNVKGFGGVFTVPKELLPKPGADPVMFVQAQAFIANLEHGEGAFEGVGATGAGGILALWRKCPHLGCSVPWNPGFEYGGAKGWFRCPCHQSTYTKAGVRVFGPAPRPMDTFAIAFDAQGRLLIDTGKITTGGEDNPRRAIPAV